MKTLSSSVNVTEAWIEYYKYKKVAFIKDDGTQLLDDSETQNSLLVVKDKKIGSEKWQVVCSKLKYKIPTRITYLQTGESKEWFDEENLKFNSIVPNSVGEQIFEAICSF